MQTADLKVILDTGEQLDYTSPEDLGIKLNRIVDDTNDITKRWGEYSYTVSFPKTRNNAKVFEFPDTKGRTKIFVGKQWNAKVINNNQTIADGIFELNEYTSTAYKGVIYSQFTQLLDSLGTKKLSDMTALPSALTWNYEKTIVQHILADYKNSDETLFSVSFCVLQNSVSVGGNVNRRRKWYDSRSDLFWIQVQ